MVENDQEVLHSHEMKYLANPHASLIPNQMEVYIFRLYQNEVLQYCYSMKKLENCIITGPTNKEESEPFSIPCALLFLYSHVVD